MADSRIHNRSQPTGTCAGGNQNSQSEATRIVGYHNAIDADSTLLSDGRSNSPPSYEHAICTVIRSRQHLPAEQCSGFDVLPSYNCTVEMETAANIKFEKSDIFQRTEGVEWSDVFVRLQGTTLCIYQLQTGGRLSKVLGAPRSERPGRLIKQYTLQHAEIGVASDMPKHELVPRTLAASMWPPQKLKRMQQEAPHLFDHVRQYIIRLRLECDQLLLRLRSWEDRATWIDHLCMAVDIAPPLDERTEPKYHTLPRRRRHRTFQDTEGSNALTMTGLIEEQERIIRDRFPHLLSVVGGEGDVGEEEASEDNTADPEAEDLDQTVLLTNHALAMGSPSEYAENSSRPLEHTLEDAPTSGTTNDVCQTTIANSLPENQKLSPTNQLDRSQELRCRRRCMPSLLFSSRRSNDIVVRDGGRWRIDWHEEILRPYPELPPTYEILDGPAVAEINSTSIHTLGSEQELTTMQSSSTATESPDGSVNLPETRLTSQPRTLKSWKHIGAWSFRKKRAERQAKDLDSGSTSDCGEGTYIHKLHREEPVPGTQQETLRILSF